MVTAVFPTPGGAPLYAGGTVIAGVQGRAAAIRLLFTDTAGSVAGRLPPTGNAREVIDGMEVTCVDNGMPVVVARAADLGITGYEPIRELADDPGLSASRPRRATDAGAGEESPHARNAARPVSSRKDRTYAG